MGSINLVRVLIGGLVAGLIINIGEIILNAMILGSDWTALRDQLGLGALTTESMTAGVFITFIYGLVLVWIYAAIRPRFGPGLKTALIAATVFWILAYLLFTASLLAGGMMSMKLMIVTSLWGVIEAPIAAIAGAWLYRE